MAIEVVGETTHGTFEELMEDVRKLNDTHGILTISVTFKKPAKQLLTLVTRREDQPSNDSVGQ